MRTHYCADHTFDLVGSMMFMSKTFMGQIPPNRCDGI